MSKDKQDLIETLLSENKNLHITKKQIQKIQENSTKDEILEFLQNNNVQENTQAEETTQSETTGLNINFSTDEIQKYFPDLENPTEENIKNFIFERLGLIEPNQENS